MKIVVGLGNPGKRYEMTRHNLGFVVIDKIKNKKLKSKNGKVKLKFNKRITAEIFQRELKGEKVLLIKPLTYMNSCGKAVKALISQFPNFRLSNLLIIHDDIDLPLGKIRVKVGGGSAGHHGVESIIRELGTDNFLRVRLGIGRSGDIEKFVLSPFIKKQEKGKLENMLKKACEKVFELLSLSLSS